VTRTATATIGRATIRAKNRIRRRRKLTAPDA
jgi:hypothetical protein